MNRNKPRRGTAFTGGPENLEHQEKADGKRSPFRIGRQMEKSMNEKVKIRLETDPSCTETEVVIRTGRRTELTDRIISAVKRCAGNTDLPITAYQGDTLVRIAPEDIIRTYTENRKLIICAESGRYEVRQPLKDLEERLEGEQYVRISRFEIMNLRKVSAFDFSSAGTIRVIFRDGSETWVARRYVPVLQQTLKDLEEQKGDEHGV